MAAEDENSKPQSRDPFPDWTANATPRLVLPDMGEHPVVWATASYVIGDGRLEIPIGPFVLGLFSSQK